MAKKGEKGKSKIKIKELKPRIKEIKPAEETLEEEIEEADEEIFNDLDSMQTGPGNADALGASHARVSLGDMVDSTAGPATTFQSNPNEEKSFNELYKTGFGLGDSRRVSYRPEGRSSSPSLIRREGEFGMQQGGSMAENTLLDPAQARLGHQEIGREEDKYETQEADGAAGKKDRYWV